MGIGCLEEIHNFSFYRNTLKGVYGIICVLLGVRIMRRRYYGMLYLLIYVVLLKVVLSITADIAFFQWGLLYDLVIVSFFVGGTSFFFRSLRSQKILYILVGIVLTIFVIGDSMYYMYFETISARSSFHGIVFLGSGNTEEYDLTFPLVGYLVTPLFIGYIIAILKTKHKDIYYLRDFLVLSLIFFIQVLLFISWGNETFDTKIEYYKSDAYLFDSMHDRSLYSSRYGYVMYHLIDFTRIRPVTDPVSTKEIVDTFYEEENFTHEQNMYSDLFLGYNLVTILAETLDTRFIDPILTPNLYMMQEEGYNFSDFYTPVFQQGATCNSEYMSLTGLSAITTNDWANNICDAYTENLFSYSLPSQLSNIGYDTYYFHSGYEWFYDRVNLMPNMGFDEIRFREDLIDKYPDFDDRFDTNMMLFWNEYVTYEEPFMVNMLSYSMHGGYNQSEFDIHKERVDSAYPNEELHTEIRNYMEKLVEFDVMLGQLLDRLEEEGVLDQTLIAIYPDHNIYMMDELVYEEYIGIDLESKELNHTDLIIYNSQMDGKTFEQIGSTIDITPTLLNLLYSEGDFSYFLGADLLSGVENVVLFPDLTIMSINHSLALLESFDQNNNELKRLEIELERRITYLEIQKKILNSDYFRLLE